MTGENAETEREAWLAVNRALLAKALSELSFEEVLAPRALGGGAWEVAADDGVTYRFRAQRRIWGNLAVAPDGILRVDRDSIAPAADAARFFVDARRTLGMEPATLAIYLQELASTIVADLELRRRRAGVTAAAMIGLPNDRLQALLDGHPKAPASKGRIGWGIAEQQAYAPEFAARFQLMWIAADRAHCRFVADSRTAAADLLADALDRDAQAALASALAAKAIDQDRAVIFPVHPWQWNTFIRPHFAGELAAGRLVPLGVLGDRYRPQQSLRTLGNADRDARFDVKLALTLLNTSAYRGIAERMIAIGPALSSWLAALAERDPVLASRKVVILREVAGAFYPHPIYRAIPDAPYRFHEMLGAVWRERVDHHLEAGEQAAMMGALAQRDGAGTPLVAATIARSGLDHATWLARLFDGVVVPLYHLICRYGAASIAHGQNITVLMRGFVPVGVAIKDFQGDFELVNAAFPEHADLPQEVAERIGRRPPEHLIHHLQTGHFASVLRFVSDALAAGDGFPEERFYAILADVLRRYQAAHPDLAPRFALFDLFRPTMARVCINRVRFKIGYADSAVRPVPDIGGDLANPLHRAAAGRDTNTAHS